jgi:hypothetical protein
MEMKKIFFSLIAIVLAMPVSAQEETPAERNKSISLEIGGPSNFVGLNYTSTFKSGSPWEYRVGLAFAYASSSNIFTDYDSMRAWSVPMGVNYLIGHHHSKLELGAGINVGLYNLHYTEWQPVSSTTGDTEIITYEGTNKKKNRMEYFLYTNVGYRHVAGNGFLFRVGITPAFNFGEGNDLKGLWLIPYISFGKAF